MIDDSQPNDEVWVAEGTYKPTVATEIGLSRTKTFKLKNQVKIFGGFDPDNGDSTFEKRNPYTNITILSGDLDSDDGSGPPTGDNALHVVYSPSTLGGATLLDGFTIRNGLADIVPPVSSLDPYYGIDHLDRGGGMLVDHSCPRIAQCVFTNNYGIKGGGLGLDGSIGVFSGDRVMRIFNCVFDGNAGVTGGGVYADESTETNEAKPVFINCLLTHNDATDRGGAMYQGNYCGSLVLNCTVTQNTADQFAGIFHAFDALEGCNATLLGDCAITNTIVYDNGNGDFDDQIYGRIALDHTCIQDLATDDDCRVLVDDTGESFDTDPDFMNPGSSNFRLAVTSPCIDAGFSGSGSQITDGDGKDIADVDQDGNTAEPTPDLDTLRRIANCTVDIGAYEYASYSCDADLTHDGVVDIDDLLAVINHWGACPTAPAFCPGDITPLNGNCQAPPAEGGAVDLDDLLAVIMHWGPCPFSGITDSSTYPQSVDDCMDAASEEYEAFTPEWIDFVNKCVDGLNEAHIIDDDE